MPHSTSPDRPDPDDTASPSDAVRVLHCDDTGRVEWASPAVRTLFGPSLVGDAWIERFSGQGVGLLRPAISRAAVGREPQAVELRLGERELLAHVLGAGSGRALVSFEDLTVSKRRERDREVDRLVDQVLATEQADAVIVLDRDLIVQRVIGPALSSRGENLEMVGRSVMDVFAEVLGEVTVVDDQGVELSVGERPVALALSMGCDQPRRRLRFRHTDGSEVHKDLWVAHIRTADDLALVIGTTDVTAQVESEIRIRDYAMMTGDLFATLDGAGRFVTLTASRELAWIEGAECMMDVIDPRDHHRLEALLRDAPPIPGASTALLRFVAPDGRPHDVNVDVARASVGNRIRIAARDVTAEESHKRALRALADRDGLTGLANRRSLLRDASSALTSSDVLVLTLDVDHFKEINDSCGHAGGDAVLVTVAERLRTACRPGDFVGRLGGDEFVVAMVAPDGEVEEVASRIQRVTSSPFDSGQFTVSFTTSVGAALGRRGMSFTDVLASADDALYEAKRRGRNRWHAMVPATGAGVAPEILIVEDNPRTSDTLRTLLGAGGDVAVRTAASAAEAAGEVDQGTPEIVVLDLRLPDGDGFTVLERIRRRGRDCEVIVYSGHLDSAARDRAAELGVEHLFDKVEVEPLLALLEARLDAGVS